MKSKSVKILPYYNNWKPWFAWYPVRAFSSEMEYCWVWWETVEKRYIFGDLFDDSVDYRAIK